MSTRTRWMAAIAVGLMLTGSMRAEPSAQAPARPMALTALDYIEIQQLVASRPVYTRRILRSVAERCRRHALPG
jgi:hypothetical protein